MRVEIKYMLGEQKVIVPDVYEVSYDYELAEEAYILIKTSKGEICEKFADIKELRVVDF